MPALASRAEALVALCLALACAVAAVDVTPVEKVMQLLTGLEEQLVQDGKQEAANYDKYACFCKEQADGKLYAIETSEKKIAELDATITKLDGELSDLAVEISTLGTQISGLEDKTRIATAVRKSEHAAYLKKSQERRDAIGFVDGAMQSIESAKAGMKGDTKLDLTEARAVIKKVAPFETALLAKLDQVPAEGDAHDYEFHSNEVHEALQSILAIFKSTLKRIEDEEATALHSYNLKVQAYSNTIKFKTEEKKQKEATSAAKTEEREQANTENIEEGKDKKSDSDFLAELEADCEKKAGLWDKRSKTRADELTALNDAITKLKEKVAPNWSTNKKLSDLQRASSASPQKPHLPNPNAPAAKPSLAKVTRRAVSFLQLRGSAKGGGNAVQQVQKFLASTASRLSSSTLTAASMRVMVSKDHFVKVRAIIKDLVAKLEADASSESTTKSECDQEMANALSSRDKANSDIESASAAITKLEAHNTELQAAVAQLKMDIAKLEKEMMEAAQLREEDKAANARTVAMAEEGISGVDFAISVLSQFYDNAFFIQRGAYTPPNADRDGNTVKDLSPEPFDSEYHGAQEASKGILGLLAVIKSDFERTKSTTETDEEDAATDFQTLETDTQGEIGNKKSAADGKVSTIGDNEALLVDRKDDLSDAEKMLSYAKKTLEGLKSKCVDGEETYQERVQKRQEEIAALKEALQMLIDWQK